MKHQTGLVNVVGTVVSADAMVFLSFSSLRETILKSLKIVTPQISKNIDLHRAYFGLQAIKTIQLNPASLSSQIQVPRLIPVEKPRQTATFNIPKHVSETSKLLEKSRQSSLKSSGCPKNLAYFNMKPRPKQTPEECFSCKNLISCVCLTD